MADGSAWVPAGALAEGRASTHAVALGNGRVLVVGSDNFCTPGAAWDESAAAEVFDPAAGTWSATESLNAPRDGFVAVTLDDGRALVTGGITGSNPAYGVYGAYSSTKLYDPQTGTWSATSLLNVARYEPAGALLRDGTVLVAGGTYIDTSTDSRLASAEIYDPESGEWSRTGNLEAARTGARAVTLADGRVLVVGGNGDIEGSWPFAGAEIYDPAAGTWASTGSMKLPREAFSLVALPDGGALVVGGLAGADSPDGTVAPATASTERFDPRTLSWSDAGTMKSAAANRTAVLLGDGRVLVAGGISGPDFREGSVAIADAELYDPATGTWTVTTPLPEARERASSVTLADGSVLLVGGDGGYPSSSEGVAVPWCPGAPTGAVRYVPANLASFPEPTPRPAAVDVAMSDVPRASASPPAAKKAAAAINAFGIDLYRRMLADGTLNPAAGAVFSPTSIAFALAMARAGAKGETAVQMDAVLHAAGWGALGRGLGALDQALASRDATWTDEEGAAHQLALRIANAAFAQRGMQIVQAYLDAIASTFGAGLRLVDYKADPEGARKLINAWVSRQTARRIPELIPQAEPPIINTLTRLVLVNAIYLKANWEIEFAREYIDEPTEPRRFTRLDGSPVTVPTMSLYGEDTVPYASGPGWKATELRYLGADGTTPLAMTLILPDDLAAFERSLSPSRLSGIVSKLDAQRTRLTKVWYQPGNKPGNEMGDCGTYAYSLHLFMPRFGIETQARLASVLKSLGMPVAFDVDRADFTGIATLPEGFYISDVIHQANIDVDEKGTEAAAATAVVMSTGGCTGASPAKTISLRLNRPFLFVLRDVETGAILFMGRVVDPSAK
jgi:serine protease inhibitor